MSWWSRPSPACPCHSRWRSPPSAQAGSPCRAAPFQALAWPEKAAALPGRLPTADHHGLHSKLGMSQSACCRLPRRPMLVASRVLRSAVHMYVLTGPIPACALTMLEAPRDAERDCEQPKSLLLAAACKHVGSPCADFCASAKALADNPDSSQMPVSLRRTMKQEKHLCAHRT